jgi:hypothetical protein
MSEGLEFSTTLGALAKALSSAQAELGDAKKDSINPHFKNRYASLASVRAAITPAFSKYELSVVQYNEPHGEGGVLVVTLLMHSSGEWIRGKLFVPVTKKDAQGFGSALSYARRYALAQIANIATDDDDDAEVAVKPPAPVKAAPPAVPAVDVNGLVEAINASEDADQLAVALATVGRVKDKLGKADLDRCVAARDNRKRELEARAA